MSVNTTKCELSVNCCFKSTILPISSGISTRKYKTSAANKGQSMDKYHQSLTFDCPYLSYNYHYDRRLFQEIFFIIFRSSHMQMFWKTSVIRNFAEWPATLFQSRPKRDLNTGNSCETCKIFMSSFFMEHLQ